MGRRVLPNYVFPCLKSRLLRKLGIAGHWTTALYSFSYEKRMEQAGWPQTPMEEILL
jgi:hypothetical protein